MQPFPEINNNQVVLMRAEYSTGYVWDDQFKVAVNDQQIVFTIFSSLEEARDAANGILLERNDVEGVIYGKNRDVLSVISPSL